MIKVERAYLAGIVDGEGTVTLMKHHKNETPIPSISVANNNLEMLKWIKGKVGGCICSKRVYNPHHNKAYAWSVKHDRALRILNDIKKYLLVKKPQADLITEKYKSVTHRAGKYTPEMLKNKMKLVAQIRRLNQR